MIKSFKKKEKEKDLAAHICDIIFMPKSSLWSHLSDTLQQELEGT